MTADDDDVDDDGVDGVDGDDDSEDDDDCDRRTRPRDDVDAEKKQKNGVKAMQNDPKKLQNGSKIARKRLENVFDAFGMFLARFWTS